MANNYLTTGVYYNGRLYNITGQIYKQSQNYSTAVLYFNNIPYYLQLFVDNTYYKNNIIELSYIKGFEVYTRNLSKPPYVGSLQYMNAPDNVPIWQGEDSNNIIRWTTRANNIRFISENMRDNVPRLNFTGCTIYDPDSDGLYKGTWNINNALNNLRTSYKYIFLHDTSPALTSFCTGINCTMNNGRIIDSEGNWRNVNYVYFNTGFFFSFNLDNRINNRLLTFSGKTNNFGVTFGAAQYANILSLSFNNLDVIGGDTGYSILNFKNQYGINNRHVLYMFNSIIVNSNINIYCFPNETNKTQYDRTIEINVKNSFINVGSLFYGGFTNAISSSVLGSSILITLNNSYFYTKQLIRGMPYFAGETLVDKFYLGDITSYRNNFGMMSNFVEININMIGSSEFYSENYPAMYINIPPSVTQALIQPADSMTSYTKLKGIKWNTSLSWYEAVVNHNIVTPVIFVSYNGGLPENSFRLGTLSPVSFNILSDAFSQMNTTRPMITAVWSGSENDYGGSRSNFLIFNPLGPSTNMPFNHKSKGTFLQVYGGVYARGWDILFNSYGNTTDFILNASFNSGVFLRKLNPSGIITWDSNHTMLRFTASNSTNMHIIGGMETSFRNTALFQGIYFNFFNFKISPTSRAIFQNCYLSFRTNYNRMNINRAMAGMGVNIYNIYRYLFSNCIIAVNNTNFNFYVEGYYIQGSGGATTYYNGDLPTTVLDTWSVKFQINTGYIYLRSIYSNVYNWLIGCGVNSGNIRLL